MTVRQTSIAVYRQIQREGLLSKLRWDVYDHLYHYGPKTAREVMAALGLETNQSGRITELLYLGCVHEVGQRRCSVSGRASVIQWDVTPGLPVPTHKPSPKATLKRVRAMLDDEDFSARDMRQLIDSCLRGDDKLDELDAIFAAV